MKRYNMKALIAALGINALFFLAISCAWFFTNHAHSNQQEKPINTPANTPALNASLVSNSSTDLNDTAMDAIVSHAFGNRVVIQKKFIAPGHLNGLVLALKDTPTEQFVAYFDPLQKLLYLGQVIDANGKNTTLEATQNYLIDANKSSILKAFQAIPAVVMGAKQAKHTITIVIDPNSVFFRTLYQNFYMDQDLYDLQIRWILVNYLKPMGPNLAGWILSAKDPAKRLAIIADAPLSQWSDLKVPSLSSSIIDTLRDHWNLMQSYHLVPGPVTLFKTKDHDYVIQGLVDTESFEQLLPDILV
jgi:hypothetical protein